MTEPKESRVFPVEGCIGTPYYNLIPRAEAGDIESARLLLEILREALQFGTEIDLGDPPKELDIAYELRKGKVQIEVNGKLVRYMVRALDAILDHDESVDHALNLTGPAKRPPSQFERNLRIAVEYWILRAEGEKPKDIEARLARPGLKPGSVRTLALRDLRELGKEGARIRLDRSRGDNRYRDYHEWFRQQVLASLSR